MWDRFALTLASRHFGPTDAALTLTPLWTGALPPMAKPIITDRRGTDLTPLDPHNPDDVLRLSAYIWPDQTDRLTRTRAAIGVATAKVDTADAADWLSTRLHTPTPDTLHLIYLTLAWQYFPTATQTKARDLITADGRAATPRTPLVWFGMEADKKGAAPR